MRATKAYIASLGTTGILLAAAMLMLAVVSGVVAFDSWPDGNVSTRLQPLTLGGQAAPIRVSARPAVVATPAPARPATRAAAGARAATGIGRVGGRRITAGLNPPATPPSPSPLPPAATAAPLVTAPPPLQPPSTTAGKLADTAQGLTDSAGEAVGHVSPPLGATVAGTGDAAAQAARDLPLP